jgi:hypothetical protein
MAVSPILEIQEVASTQSDKTTTINDMVVQLEAAFNDQLVLDFTSGNITLTFAQFSRYGAFIATNLPTDRTLTIPLLTLVGGLAAKRIFMVRNTSGFNLTVGGTTGATVTLSASSAASIQSDGTDCTAYAAGGPGATGPQGATGGGIEIPYTFSTTTTNADPGNGFLRLNNATQSSATAIYLDLLSSDTTDWTTVLDTLDASTNSVKGHIRLFKTLDPTKWIVFELTARVLQTGYRELTVTEIGSSASSPFANNDAITLSFARAGDQTTFSATDFANLDLNSVLPTSDPGSGKPWLNGGAMQVGP